MGIHTLLPLLLAFYCVQSQYIHTPYQPPPHLCCQQLKYPSSCCPLACCSPMYSVLPCCSIPGPEPGSKVRASFRLAGAEWDSRLDDTNSTEYIKLEKLIVDALYKTLDSDPHFRNARLSRFEQGSIVAVIVLEIANGSPNEDTVSITIETLKATIQNGTLGSLAVDPMSFTVNEIVRGSEVMPKVEPEKLDVIGNYTPTNAPTDKSSTPMPEETEQELMEFRQNVETAHNQYRTLHVAQPLKLLSELDMAAEQWAEELAMQRILKHAPPDKRQGQGESIVQRCAVGGSGLTGKMAVDMWYNEVKDPGYNFSIPNPNHNNSHFTQIVWKGTQYLGVGRKTYEQDGRICTIVVARYKPAGNVEGQYYYNVGRGSFQNDAQRGPLSRSNGQRQQHHKNIHPSGHKAIQGPHQHQQNDQHQQRRHQKTHHVRQGAHPSPHAKLKPIRIGRIVLNRPGIAVRRHLRKL